MMHHDGRRGMVIRELEWLVWWAHSPYVSTSHFFPLVTPPPSPNLFNLRIEICLSIFGLLRGKNKIVSELPSNNFKDVKEKAADFLY